MQGLLDRVATESREPPDLPDGEARLAEPAQMARPRLGGHRLQPVEPLGPDRGRCRLYGLLVGDPRRGPRIVRCRCGIVNVLAEAGNASEQVENHSRLADPRVADILRVAAPRIFLRRRHPGAGRIPVNVPHRRKQLLVGADRDAREARGEDVSDVPPPLVEVAGVRGRHQVREPAQLTLGIVDEQVHVVAHEAPRHHAQREPLERPPQHLKERLVVSPVLKQHLLARAPHDDVIEPLLRQLPWSPRHVSPNRRRARKHTRRKNQNKMPPASGSADGIKGLCKLGTVPNLQTSGRRPGAWP